MRKKKFGKEFRFDDMIVIIIIIFFLDAGKKDSYSSSCTSFERKRTNLIADKESVDYSPSN